MLSDRIQNNLENETPDLLTLFVIPIIIVQSFLP